MTVVQNMSCGHLRASSLVGSSCYILRRRQFDQLPSGGIQESFDGAWKHLVRVIDLDNLQITAQ